MSDHTNIEAMRHSLAHIMAAAVQKQYPNAQFGVGPVIDNGFYYDIKLDKTLSSDDLATIEADMKTIIEEAHDFVRVEMPIDEAIDYFKAHHQPFKVELLHDLKTKGTTAVKDSGDESLVGESVAKVTTVTVYKTGDFVDLCRGPHLENSSQAGVFKLTKLAGAYWRGKEGNPQMQRIYGIAFATQPELDEYLNMLEEAEKRDHRKLGKELDLFAFSDLVGPGLPVYTPRGTVLITQIKKVLESISERYDMQLVSSPHLAKLDLYRISGHADKFEDELFMVKSHYNQEFVLKPVSCPHHTQIYASRPRSYRDLPIRMVEQAMQYRDEKPGAIGGLTRTRGFMVDDGHTFCRLDQVEQEASMLVEIIEEFYKKLGLWENHWVSLSLRDPKTPEKYIGDDDGWTKAEEMLANVSTKYNLEAKRMEGEAAIYGPKLDFMFKDALGRETQLATVQIDFAMPGRFGLVYTQADGSDATPVMIHRAILGSFERFIAILIEHFAGAFPTWLSPEQVRVLPVSDKFAEYGKKVVAELKTASIRVTLDDDNESLGKRIRNAEGMKVPYVLVVGEREQESGEVAVRKRGEGDLGSKSVEAFCREITGEIESRKT